MGGPTGLKQCSSSAFRFTPLGDGNSSEDPPNSVTVGQTWQLSVPLRPDPRLPALSHFRIWTMFWAEPQELSPTGFHTFYTCCCSVFDWCAALCLRAPW